VDGEGRGARLQQHEVVRQRFHHGGVLLDEALPPLALWAAVDQHDHVVLREAQVAGVVEPPRLAPFLKYHTHGNNT
jgi:hypothetical protein